MAKIRVLSENIQNMIAAGEVVERPSSVVKELMENSLDAGADEIWVEIEGGGQVLVMVQDNGHGMDRDDLPLAVLRHATSKISSREDLFSISSFGFRGEALPSIGAVSHLRVCSRTEDSDVGYCIEVVYGIQKDISVCTLNKGTRVEVKDLFLKMPGRLKFLKSTSVESKRCEEVFYKIALCHEDKEFHLKRDGKERFRFLKKQGVISRLKEIWPKNVVENLNVVTNKFMDYKLIGYVSDPKYPHTRPDRMIFFVNNRPVKDKLLIRALKEAYSGKLLSREYPCGVLFISVPPDFVDVNVHPSKTEVRFRDESTIFSLIYRWVRAALESIYYIPKRQEIKVDARDISSVHKYNTQGDELDISLSFKESGGAYVVEGDEEVNTCPTVRKDGYLYLGQIGNSYLVLKHGEDRLIVLDQHAVHERVLYERYKKEGMKSSQRLLSPLKIEIPPDRDGRKVLEGLKKIGFHGEVKGKYLLILGVPFFLDESDIREVVMEYVSIGGDRVDLLLKLISCKKAIKANTPLTPHEANELISLWLECTDRDFCPHGRPASIVLSKKELDGMFKR